MLGCYIERGPDEGLRLDGILTCSWPGGRWVEANAANMVLGYGSVDAQQYQRCVPQDLPLISTWSDQSRGAAAIYIEVMARRGPIIESLWGIRRVYLDLNALPGDPREAIDDANLRTEGFVGWEWLLSEHEERRQIRAAYEQLLRQPSFTEFYSRRSRLSVAAWFVQLSGAVSCTVERGRAGWKLTAFYAGG